MEAKQISPDKDVWVLLEYGDGLITESSLEVLCEGRRIADKLGEKVCIVLIGQNIKNLAESLSDYGADKIYLLESPLFAEYAVETYATALSNFMSEQNARILLCTASPAGNELMTRIAVRLKTGLVKDCVGFDLSADGLLQQTKPIHGNKVYATIACPTARPQMATLKSGIIAIKRSTTCKKPEVFQITPQLSQSEPLIKRESFIKADPKTIDIDEAEILVAGGRGVGSAEKFKLLEELADILGGSVAASMVPVDEGWISKKRMVGQTGLTVSPKLFIACGISGAHHHVMGMKDSKIIIAINSDRYAPIFNVADIKIIGNLLEILPAINHQLHERLANTTKKGNKAG